MTLALLLALQAEPDDDLGRGPLHMTSQSPFQTLRPGFTPRPPASLPDDLWEIRITESWANIWAFNEDDYIIDMEVLHSNLAVARSLSGGWRFEVELEISARSGGGMDRLINQVHDNVGAEERHRNEFPKNGFMLNLMGRDGRPSGQLSNADRGFFAHAMVGTAQWTFSKGGPGRPALSTSVSFRVELGSNDDLSGGSPVDVAWSLSGAERLGPVIVSLSGVVSWFGKEYFGDIPLEPVQVAGLLAFEWPLHEDLSVVLQYLASQGAAEDWLDFSKPSHEIMLGIRAGVGETVEFEIGLLENVGIPDNSPDFGFHAGLSIRF
ncbi:MAG TPA: DUF3187 family protein [Planctomycetota bacterium]